ncbi:MAG: hypothetical protein ACQEQS_08115 [Thermodesulfobacteriota bacterium]
MTIPVVKTTGYMTLPFQGKYGILMVFLKWLINLSHGYRVSENPGLKTRSLIYSGHKLT